LSNIKKHYPVTNGSLFIWTTDKKIDISIFAQQKKEARKFIYSLIQHKNLTKHERVFNVDSRRTLQKIKFNDTVYSSIREILFENGKLSPKIVTDISQNNDINIQPLEIDNTTTIDDDVRHQFSFKEDSEVSNKIRQFLYSQQIVTDDEHIYEIGIIVGGTKNQHLHYDCPRIFFGDLNTEEGIGEEGFEINRQQYNNDMALSIAPSSILFDVSDEKNGISLGVLTDFITKQNGTDICTIKNGRPNEEFRIESEFVDNTNKIIIHDNNGFGLQFVGDFPHFGTINAKSEDAKNALNAFAHMILKFRMENPTGFSENANEEIIQQTLNIEHIDKITRLFMKTRPKESCILSYAQESVGIILQRHWTTTKYENYNHILIASTQNTTLNKSPDETVNLINLEPLTKNKKKRGRPRKAIIEINDSDNSQQKKTKSTRIKLKQPLTDLCDSEEKDAATESIVSIYNNKPTSKRQSTSSKKK
jgi:hypothetical protein